MEASETTRTPEALRQHMAWAEARARLNRLCEVRKPAPPPVVLKKPPLLERSTFESLLNPYRNVFWGVRVSMLLRLSRYGNWPIRFDKRYRQPLDTSKRIAEHIVSLVSKHTGISRIDIMSQRRSAIIVRARHICFYLMQEFTSWGCIQMADFIGGRDHTTALSAVNRIARFMETDPAVRELVETLSAIIREGIQDGFAKL